MDVFASIAYDQNNLVSNESQHPHISALGGSTALPRVRACMYEAQGAKAAWISAGQGWGGNELSDPSPAR